MAKNIIKTKSEKNSVIKHSRGVSITTSVTVNEPLHADQYKYISATKDPKSFEDSLRDIVINFMRVLKDNGYPYRPSYKIASNNTTGNKSLLFKLSNDFSLEPLDTFYVFGNFIQQYHTMKLRQTKDAPSEELIEWAFKLGNTHQKALIFLRETNSKSKAAHHSRTDPDVTESIVKLAETEMTAKEAFSYFVSDIDGKETMVNNNLCVTYLNTNDIEKKITFKTFQNKLSIERSNNKNPSI
jgi:hypothetical protein